MVSSSVYGCCEAAAAEPEFPKRAFREVVSSGEASRYGLSKRTDLLLLRAGVVFAAANSEAREVSLGVVVDVVGVCPLNCADSSWYCLRSFGSWVCRSDVLLRGSCQQCILYFTLLFLAPLCLLISLNLPLHVLFCCLGWGGKTYSPSTPSCSSACALKVSSPARKDSSDRVMGPSLVEGSFSETARWRSSSESLMWSARRKSWCGDVDMVCIYLCVSFPSGRGE